jgi:hypothetical protein
MKLFQNFSFGTASNISGGAADRKNPEPGAYSLLTIDCCGEAAMLS